MEVTVRGFFVFYFLTLELRKTNYSLVNYGGYIQYVIGSYIILQLKK